MGIQWYKSFILLEWHMPKVTCIHQGGALALAFPTRASAPPANETVTGIAGVIATSPLILQAKPAAKAARWIGGKASLLAPSLTIPAEVKGQVLTTLLSCLSVRLTKPL